MTDKTIDLAIILSTYNGEQYLRAQLDSILQQTVKANLILIRDDGSTDSTKAILKEYEAKHSAIFLMEDNLGNVGVLRSYSLLLRHLAELDVVHCMFADQDDVWFDDKTERLLPLLKSMDNTKPALVFSDVKLVDSDLNLIANSLVDYQKLVPEKGMSLKALLFYSPALGCTMVFNKALLNEILSLWDNFPNPDKWALLVAASLGEIKYLPETTIFYRQHAFNVTGALRGIHRKNLSFANLRFLQKRYQTALDEVRILEKHLPHMPEKNKVLIKQFKALFARNYIQRLTNYCRFCLTPPHWKRKAGLFLSLFLNYK